MSVLLIFDISGLYQEHCGGTMASELQCTHGEE